MAGEWIKMRVGLRRHPKVVRIVSALGTDRFRVVGALHAVWSVFDEHSVDGHLPGYSFEQMDEEIGWPGFSAAMHGIGWLQRDGECGLQLPEFSTHNGSSAKRRATESERKRQTRASDDGPQDVRKLSANLPSENGTREEKRRDISVVPNGTTAQQVPHQEIIALYHEVLPEHPRVRDWTEKRKRILSARWHSKSNRQNLDYWRRYFEHVRASDFLCGRTQPSPGRTTPFIANLEWLLTEANFVSVVEGKYHEPKAA